jgi:hypothetical protein
VCVCVCMIARWSNYRLLVGLMKCSLIFLIILKMALVKNLASSGNFLSMSVAAPRVEGNRGGSVGFRISVGRFAPNLIR